MLLPIFSLGSGEDDDEYDEMSAREDETITSIGAAAAQVENDNQVSHPSETCNKSFF